MTEPGLVMLIALLIDRGTPTRLRLSEDAWIDRIIQYQGMPSGSC